VGTFARAAEGAGRAPGGGRASAISRFAAYSSPSEKAIASSPESASTWNSCDALPPMLPVSARTARKRRFMRVKMREYASCIAW
jgi:hypothetical protein